MTASDKETYVRGYLLSHRDLKDSVYTYTFPVLNDLIRSCEIGQKQSMSESRKKGITKELKTSLTAVSKSYADLIKKITAERSKYWNKIKTVILSGNDQRIKSTILTEGKEIQSKYTAKVRDLHKRHDKLQNLLHHL